ncbi:HigA family addiction module antidote protein [bacterium]|nr:HigA family addiction module antidote protein [bacterium]
MFLKSENYIAVPPGATIKEQLNDRGLTQKEFALRMELSEKHISKLINGQVALTPDVALKLEMVLGIKMRFWLNLEALYQEAKKKVEDENNLLQDKETLLKFPYNEMSKLNWLPKTKNIVDKIKNLRNFFEVVTLTLLKGQLIPLFCRQLSKTDKNYYLLITLAQKAKLESRNKSLSSLNLKLLKDNISKLRAMTKQDNFIIDLQNLLSKCGIAFILLPSLKGSYTHGFTFLDNNKIIIGMTNRGKDSDKFWFSLFHELGHILCGHIFNDKIPDDKDEQEADIFAKEQLISKEDFDVFTADNNFSKKSIIEFAKQIDIDPSIVVGRLQKEGFLKYNQLNNLKKKYLFDEYLT